MDDAALFFAVVGTGKYVVESENYSKPTNLHYSL